MESQFLTMCVNASDSNVTSELWMVEDRTSGIVTAVFMLLFIVISLPWNLLVIVTIVKQRLYTQPTIILLLNLVVTDLLLLVLYLPFLAAIGISGEFIIGDSDSSRCKNCEAGLLVHIFTLNSVYTITLMAFDRFLFIYKPLKYDRYITSWRVLIAIAMTWILTSVVALLPLIGYGEVIFYHSLLMCFAVFSFSRSYYYVILLSVVVIPLVPLLIFNIWVFVIVQKNIMIVYSTRELGETETVDTEKDDVYKSVRRKRQQKEINLIRVFGGLFCTDLIAWLPIITITVLLFFDVGVPSGLSAAVNICFTSQVLLHPLDLSKKFESLL